MNFIYVINYIIGILLVGMINIALRRCIHSHKICFIVLAFIVSSPWLLYVL